MGLPDSSLRGFCMGCAGRAAEGSEVVASVRRGTRCIEACGDALLEAGDIWCFRADGARKSRYSGREVAAILALLKALTGCAGVLVVAVLATRKHDAHTFNVEPMTYYEECDG
jgi:hypothetical protein